MLPPKGAAATTMTLTLQVDGEEDPNAHPTYNKKQCVTSLRDIPFQPKQTVWRDSAAMWRGTSQGVLTRWWGEGCFANSYYIYIYIYIEAAETQPQLAIAVRVFSQEGCLPRITCILGAATRCGSGPGLVCTFSVIATRGRGTGTVYFPGK